MTDLRILVAVLLIREELAVCYEREAAFQKLRPLGQVDARLQRVESKRNVEG